MDALSHKFLRYGRIATKSLISRDREKAHAFIRRNVSDVPDHPTIHEVVKMLVQPPPEEVESKSEKSKPRPEMSNAVIVAEQGAIGALIRSYTHFETEDLINLTIKVSTHSARGHIFVLRAARSNLELLLKKYPGQIDVAEKTVKPILGDATDKREEARRAFEGEALPHLREKAEFQFKHEEERWRCALEAMKLISDKRPIGTGTSPEIIVPERPFEVERAYMSSPPERKDIA